MRDASSLTQPLVSRPAYGERSIPNLAQSKLPSGGPADRGLPLDKAIPGTSTFNKPEDDIRDFDKPKDESIYRVDNADDLLKDQSKIEVNEDNADKHDGIGAWGEGKWDTTVKTKYPYRDDIPNQHNASSEFVAEMWKLGSAHDLHVQSETMLRVASTPEEIIRGLNPKYKERARGCSVGLKRADIKNLRWIFSVDCGNGAKVIRIKAFRQKNVTKLAKMDLDLSCSCPAWRWLGPEHHAQREDYLDKEPRGTASVPVIRDPTGINRVCKHVAAVLSHIKSWTVPAQK